MSRSNSNSVLTVPIVNSNCEVHVLEREYTAEMLVMFVCMQTLIDIFNGDIQIVNKCNYENLQSRVQILWISQFQNIIKLV